MKKAALTLLSVGILCTACNGFSTYQDDVLELKKNTPQSYDSQKTLLPFFVEGTYANSSSVKGFYLISLVVSYKNERLENVKLIMMPSSVDENEEATQFPSLGYGTDGAQNIDKVASETTHQGVILNFTASKYDVVYKVRLSTASSTYFFTFNEFEALE